MGPSQRPPALPRDAARGGASGSRPALAVDGGGVAGGGATTEGAASGTVAGGAAVTEPRGETSAAAAAAFAAGRTAESSTPADGGVRRSVSGRSHATTGAPGAPTALGATGRSAAGGAGCVRTAAGETGGTTDAGLWDTGPASAGSMGTSGVLRSVVTAGSGCGTRTAGGGADTTRGKASGRAASIAGADRSASDRGGDFRSITIPAVAIGEHQRDEGHPAGQPRPAESCRVVPNDIEADTGRQLRRRDGRDPRRWGRITAATACGPVGPEQQRLLDGLLDAVCA